MLAGAMAAAVCVISANKGIHEGLSALLVKQERVEGEALERWLQHFVVSTVATAAAVLQPLPCLKNWKEEEGVCCCGMHSKTCRCVPSWKQLPHTGCPTSTAGHNMHACTSSSSCI
jgi:hypothetical protein